MKGQRAGGSQTLHFTLDQNVCQQWNVEQAGGPRRLTSLTGVPTAVLAHIAGKLTHLQMPPKIYPSEKPGRLGPVLVHCLSSSLESSCLD